ncbi:MAG: TolC family protein [Bacteroidales bacterium]|nr:TolC family protein [Bacteroidales bacterium]
MLKKVTIYTVFLFWVMLSFAQGGVLTLDSCLALVKTNNAQFKISQYEIEKAREVKAQVFTKYFPQVSLGYSAYYAMRPLLEYSVNDLSERSGFGEFVAAVVEVLNDPAVGGNVPTEVTALKKGHGVNAMAVAPLYAGGRIVNGNRLAKLGVEAAELKAEVTERDLLEEVESSYYLVLGLKEKEQTLKMVMALIDSLEHTVDKAMGAGLITRSDKLRIALKRNEFMAKETQLRNGILLASQLLCHQIGIPYPEGGLQLENDLDRIESFASEGSVSFARPERRLLELQVEAENLYKKMALGEALPQVGVGAVATYGNLMDKAKFNALLFGRVSVPLTQWWETSHKLKEHEWKIRTAEMQQQELNEKMMLQERQAYNQMVEARSLLRSDSAALDMAEENYRLAELNYKAGMNTITDVLEANALLLQARNAITDRQITYATACRRYHDLTGK